VNLSGAQSDLANKTQVLYDGLGCEVETRQYVDSDTCASESTSACRRNKTDYVECGVPVCQQCQETLAADSDKKLARHDAQEFQHPNKKPPDSP